MQTPFNTRIKKAREKLAETQGRFGERFGNTATAVSFWEQGKRQAPYEVLLFVEDVLGNWRPCLICNGTGWNKEVDG
jgi:transcriptional regulator with XRE-family HTH domain